MKIRKKTKETILKEKQDSPIHPQIRTVESNTENGTQGTIPHTHTCWRLYHTISAPFKSESYHWEL